VAHASLAGVAIAFLIAVEPLIIALIVGCVLSITITYFKKNTKISSDAIIGMFYTVLFAIGVIILNTSTTFQPELSTYLFGSILSITWTDISYSLIALIISITTLLVLYPKIVYVAFDPEAAHIRGIKVNRYEYFINVMTSIAIIVAIKVVGIVLVTALLVIPATTAKYLARKFSHMIPISVTQNILAVILGIVTSYHLNTPPGATIVIISGMIFLIAYTTTKIINSLN